VKNWGKPSSGGTDSLLYRHGCGFSFSYKGRGLAALKDDNAQGNQLTKSGKMPETTRTKNQGEVLEP
jgi:hypothetical protein